MPNFRPITRHSSSLAAFCFAVCASTPAFAQVAPSLCGPLAGPGQYGPYDYRNEKQHLERVERPHFKPDMEALIQGSHSNDYIGGSLDYTLRASPNHHRALMAMLRYTEKTKNPKPPGARYSIECYFERAVRFRPDDLTVRMIFATFLAKNARAPEALQQLNQVTALAGDNPFSHYNLGLVYFDMKEYDKALLQAHKAIELGFPQTALRDQLQSVGKWNAPSGEAAQTPAVAAPKEPPDVANPISITAPPIESSE